MEAGVDPAPLLANGLSPLDLAQMNDDGEGSHARVVELLGTTAELSSEGLVDRQVLEVYGCLCRCFVQMYTHLKRSVATFLCI